MVWKSELRKVLFYWFVVAPIFGGLFVAAYNYFYLLHIPYPALLSVHRKMSLSWFWHSFVTGYLVVAASNASMMLVFNIKNIFIRKKCNKKNG